VDIKTASSLLGHTNLATTERYVRIANSMKQKAVDKLPEIDLTPSKAS
jgi:site-specific recombinase XerD